MNPIGRLPTKSRASLIKVRREAKVGADADVPKVSANSVMVIHEN